MADQIEGTILTQGNGPSRGTRFALPASSEKLNTGGMQKGMSDQGGIVAAESGINPSSVQLRARSLDPLQVKPMTSDTGLTQKAFESTGELIVRAAYNYADRVEESQATQAILDFKDDLRNSFFGSDDGQTKGFSSLQGQAAVDSRKEYFDSIDQKFASTLSELSPSVKQKALTRLSAVREEVLNRASTHILTEQKRYEQQLQARKADDLTRDLVLDPGSAAKIKENFFGLFGPNGEKDARDQWDKGLVISAHRVYLDAYRSTGTGLTALTNFREQVKNTAGTDALNVLDAYTNAQKNQEDVAARSKLADAKRLEKEVSEKSAIGLMKLADNDVTKISNITDVYSLAPNISLPEANAVMRYVQKLREPDAAATREKLTDFMIKVVDPIQLAGSSFSSFGDFLNTAVDYGLRDTAKIKSVWDQVNKPLTDDQAVLKEQRKGVLNSLDKAFNPSGSAISTDAEGHLVISAGGKKPDPPYLRSLKQDIFNISEDKTITPFERSQKIHDYIAKKIADTGAPKELQNVNNIDVLATGFKVKHYVQMLTEKQQQESANLQNQDNQQYKTLPSSQSGSPYGDFTSDEQKYLSTTHSIAPSVAGRDSLIEQAISSGFAKVHFVQNATYTIKGRTVKFTGYVGDKKLKDGTFQEVPLNIVRGK